jgi:hypothetical protein
VPAGLEDLQTGVIVKWLNKYAKSFVDIDNLLAKPGNVSK